MFYKIINNIVPVNFFSEYLQRTTNRTRGHQLKFLLISTRANTLYHSFLARAIRLWNLLPDHIVTVQDIYYDITRLSQGHYLYVTYLTMLITCTTLIWLYPCVYKPETSSHVSCLGWQTRAAHQDREKSFLKFIETAVVFTINSYNPQRVLAGFKLVRVNFAATAKVIATLNQSNRSTKLPWIQ